MRDLLKSLFAWWRGRPAPEPERASSPPEEAPAPAEPPRPAPGETPRAESRGEPVPRAEEEQSFREMVRLAKPPDSDAPPAVAPPAGGEARERTLAALRDLRQIPALQSLARAFVETAGRVDVDVADVVASIEKDSALCVRVLGMANSVGVGSERRVEDLATAVHLLGVVRVRRLAQALFTLRDSQRMTEGLDWRHLWVHAFATAALAEELDNRLGSRAALADEVDSPVHLAGLLHDVGKIVLSTVAPETYREILVAAWRGEGRLEDLERARLGVTHREAGVIFAEHQKLPELVVAVIGAHAAPETAEKFRFEVAVVALANFLSKAHGLGFSGARWEESDGDFAQQAAWRVIGETRGQEVTEAEVEAIEDGLARFVAGLRGELKALRSAE